AAASELPNPTMLALAEAVLAAACSFTGDSAEGKEHCLAAAALIDAMDDDELAVRLEAAGHLAAAEMYLEWFDKTATHAARGVAVARAAGRDDVFPTLFPCLGSSLALVGRFDESIEVLEGAVEAARLSGNAQAIAWSLLNVAFAALMKGDVDYALRAGKESVEVAGTAGATFVSAYAAAHFGWVLLESGDPGAAAELMVSAGGGPRLVHTAGGWRANHLEVLTRCFLALGRTDDARAAATEAMAVADQVGLPRTVAMAHKAAAELALAEGDAQTAVDHARRAVEGTEASSSSVDAAMARILLGQALARAGDVTQAVAVLEQAATELDGFGAHRYRDQAEQELRRLGYRVHRRSRAGRAETGMGSLSGRELEVVRLVVDRRTNAEIAADLFLSLKTVETHLRNIFRKLGVTSRVEVARLAQMEAGTLDRVRVGPPRP
ncbi:MAG: LuxR C-terminal-related transcriptional regulator, partial [Actinomycetota bacterium]|nr:LuxR C-terminal-related transcriptional regulator [Actinomycetota bacterium]